MNTAMQRDRVLEGVWLLLVLSTVATWILGDERLFGGDAAVAAVLILAISAVKVWLIVAYFMEVRQAPLVLRAAFLAYLGVVFASLAGLYLLR